MTKMKADTGEVFKAFNKYMTPPKLKYHLCINDEMYLIINTKEARFSCQISPADCSLLTHVCYINCATVRTEIVNNFNIIAKEQLSQNALKVLYERIKLSFSITQNQKNIILKELSKVIKV